MKLRLAVVALVLFGLSACSFQPLYKESSGQGRESTAQELSQIYVPVLADRSGQYLRNHLMTRLTPKGQPSHPVYQLNVNLQRQDDDVGIRKDQTATRRDITQIARFSLQRISDGETVFSAMARTTTSYNLLDFEYATDVAERSAMEKGLTTLANSIELRLAVFFSQENQANIGS